MPRQTEKGERRKAASVCRYVSGEHTAFVRGFGLLCLGCADIPTHEQGARVRLDEKREILKKMGWDVEWIKIENVSSIPLASDAAARAA